MTEPSRPSEDALLSWFDTLSRWGLWGSDDFLGSVNYITPAMRVSAARLVNEGISVSLGGDIVPGAPMDPGVPGPNRFMLGTGLGLSGSPERGRPTRFPDDSAFAMEYFGLVFHGNSITHIDALSHGFFRNKMFNGHPASKVNDWQGATIGDVRNLKDGIVTRGILFDIASIRGKPWLEPGEAVYPEDLDEAERQSGITVGEGDVILLRTGEQKMRRESLDPPDPNAGRPGYHASCLPWFADHRLAAIGSDVIQDVMPSGYDVLVMPVHVIGMVALGLWLVDNCDLETLSDTCQRLRRWSFMFMLSPIRIAGGTGSPTNPLALF